MWKSLALVAIFSVLAQSAPAPQASEEIPPLISFKNGRVGVNFLGFKASAGLGGLLTGNAADGGLGASAETPFGQRAGAGLGGVVDGNGRSAGGLYAGATAGNGLAAGAGLGGVAGESGTYGGSFAGATNPYSGHQVVKASESGTIVEAPISVRKEVHVNAVPTTTYVKTRFSEEVVNPGSIKVVQKIKHRPHHHKVHYKYISQSQPWVQ
ncbi:glycine-rich protein 1 isoform X2 [Aethina tumida]|uniref:glycine-rich protein 1 isoform X2 n=1 Tax=Aethina tumida TaxID=116153 RepID=UPI00096AF433|nr:glycine-rich protein 1 isoform X2 [Aethina tumida]